ncbi:MAG: hypothetical protein IJE71_07625 [Clostridia bacterium]|nr:hypothetical protein [Clostridia bacterium]
MRIDLLGLRLDDALAVLEGEGIVPRVMLTSAPRRREETRGVLRVVYASDSGSELTAARFLDPLAEEKEETG